MHVPHPTGTNNPVLLKMTWENNLLIGLSLLLDICLWHIHVEKFRGELDIYRGPIGSPSSCYAKGGSMRRANCHCLLLRSQSIAAHEQESVRLHCLCLGISIVIYGL